MPNCSGRATQNAHVTTRMEFVKAWTIQGKHQKKPLTVELYKCPVCKKTVRQGTYKSVAGNPT